MCTSDAPWWVLLQHSIMLRVFFIVEYAIARFLCAMRVFEVLASSPSSRLYLCAKFRFFRGLHRWASPSSKTGYSVTQFIWCSGNRSLRLGIFNAFQCSNLLYSRCDTNLCQHYIGLKSQFAILPTLSLFHWCLVRWAIFECRRATKIMTDRPMAVGLH